MPAACGGGRVEPRRRPAARPALIVPGRLDFRYTGLQAVSSHRPGRPGRPAARPTAHGQRDAPGPGRAGWRACACGSDLAHGGVPGAGGGLVPVGHAVAVVAPLVLALRAGAAAAAAWGRTDGWRWFGEDAKGGVGQVGSGGAAEDDPSRGGANTSGFWDVGRWHACGQHAENGTTRNGCNVCVL